MSVLVRSIDRNHLQEALDSVALQTYPNIEVVVVAAQPGHRPLPQHCGPHPLRLIPSDAPLPRSKAANRALNEARGEYLLFLDDDDWLMPGHVARLAEALQHQPKALAAYTGVSLASDNGQPLGQVMDLPFDGTRQLAGNLTPIHAVMFSRQLLALGARFDEALDHYEDWDFWLQLGQHTVFVHLPGVSAVYRIHDSSGVHADPGPGGLEAQRIYDKWQVLWQPRQRSQLMQRAWAAQDLELALQSANLTIEQQQAALAQLQMTLDRQQATIHEQAITAAQLYGQNASHVATIATRDAQIAALMNSTSWKVTAPLRWISSALKRRS